MSKTLNYLKAITAALGSTLIILNQSGVFVGETWFTYVVAVASVFGIAAVPNIKPSSEPASGGEHAA